MAIAAAAAAGALIASNPSASGATISNVFTATSATPYATTDLTGQPVSYIAVNLANASNNPGISNGVYTSLVGTVRGTFTSNTTLANGTVTTDSGNSADSAYQYDSNGFRLVGEYTTSSTGAYATNLTVVGVTPAGAVLGYQSRSSANNTSTGILGNETWLSTPTGPTTASDVYLGIFNANTQYNAATSVTTTIVGTTITTTKNYEQYSNQYGISLNGAYAVGYSQRFAGDSSPAVINGGQANSAALGYSAWIETAAGVPTEIGLTTGNNAYTATYTNTSNGMTYTTGTYYQTTASGVNINGAAFGGSNAYTGVAAAPGTSLGSDGWVYNGPGGSGISVAVGMYQSGQSLSVANTSGGAASVYNYYYTPAANGGSTPQTSQGRSTTIKLINSNGVVAGISNYYAAGQATTTQKGQVAFTYDGTNYNVLGFAANNFTSATFPETVGTVSFVNAGSASNNGVQNSTLVAMNAATVTGTSNFWVGQGYNSAGGALQSTSQGIAAWSQSTSGANLTRIGLWNQGPTYTYTAAANANDPGTSANFTIHQSSTVWGVSSDSPVYMNAGGLIAGTSARYAEGTTSSLGTDVWVYDPNAGPGGTTYPIDPADANSTTQYVLETVNYISDNGFVVGQYRNASSSAQLSTYIWSDAAPLTSFTILNGVSVTNLTSAGYADLINSYYVDPSGTISYETVATGTGTSSTIAGLATVSVPEPASLSLVAVAFGSLLGRRRRRA